MKKIVILGGGSATCNMASGFRQLPAHITIIVSPADSGGSSGLLRRELAVMPYGDIRQSLIGLSDASLLIKELFNYRFDKGGLEGHSVGNIILAALQKITGSQEAAIKEAAGFLSVQGEVVFASKQGATLSAKLEDGTIIAGEHEIDEPEEESRSPIKKLLISASVANPKALLAIKNADAIILGPGDLYTSTLPNLLVPGIAKAIANSKAKKILVTNIMTKSGQTDGFTASVFLAKVNEYLQSKNSKGAVDTVLVNTETPSKPIIERYRKENAVVVAPDLEQMKERDLEIIATPLISKHIFEKAKGDSLKRSLLRHDPKKTAAIIWKLLQ